MPGNKNQEIVWWNRALKVGEASEVVEADKVNEALQILKPERSLLRTSELSKFLNSALFCCFETKSILLNFSTFPVRGCWGQLMLLFWKLVHETQISKPLKATRQHNSTKLLIILPLRADLLCILHYETPCTYHCFGKKNLLEQN